MGWDVVSRADLRMGRGGVCCGENCVLDVGVLPNCHLDISWVRYLLAIWWRRECVCYDVDVAFSRRTQFSEEPLSSHPILKATLPIPHG
jgi:hypothetical protein